MEHETFISSSTEETKKLAASFLEKTLKEKREGALVIGLEGELGAGKTHFAKGVAEHLGIERNITSPTFVLMKRYGPTGGGFKNFYHLDCYRIYSAEEILDLGWEEIISDPKNIVLVEWAERIKDVLPPGTIWLHFKNKGEDNREIKSSLE